MGETNPAKVFQIKQSNLSSVYEKELDFWKTQYLLF